MAELGRINPEQRIACPHCRALLDEDMVSSLMEGNELPCSQCLQPVKLPDRAVEAHRKRTFLGTGLDITI